MASPDGNGSSTGEGRKGALLLLRGRPPDADGTSERASTLPSSNALRPDSGLNLGWYRPAPPDERPADGGDRDELSSRDEPRRLEEPDSIVTATATATYVDLRANPAPSDLSDSPLGARRPRGTPARSPQRETGLARVGVANARRLAAALLAPVAREARKRPRAVGIAAVLFVALAVVTALEQPANQQRNAAQPGSAHSANQFSGGFLSEVTRGLDALSRSEIDASLGTVAQAHSGRSAHRPSGAGRARAGRSKHAIAARVSASSGRVSHAAVTSQSLSQPTPSAGSDSATTAAERARAQSTSEQRTTVQQTNTQQPIHDQPPARPAGPAGLGSQVGGTCDPKCS
jgi:hypothetical protein